MPGKRGTITLIGFGEDAVPCRSMKSTKLGTIWAGRTVPIFLARWAPNWRLSPIGIMPKGASTTLAATRRVVDFSLITIACSETVRAGRSGVGAIERIRHCDRGHSCRHPLEKGSIAARELAHAHVDCSGARRGMNNHAR